MVIAKTPTGEHRYGYDEKNRRIFKETPNTTYRFVYAEQNEIGACDNDGNLIEFRLLGHAKGAEIGGAVAFEIGDVVYIPIHDAQGSVVCLNDVNGNSVADYHYSTFGEQTLYGNQCEKNPWRFSRKRYDSETEFTYFGRRYYFAELGRWVTPDPIGFEGGPNLYAYVLNSPLTHFDLYGLFSACYNPSVFALGETLYKRDIQNETNPITFHKNPFDNKPAEYHIIEGKEHKHWHFYFTNGMCNSRNEAIDNGKHFSKMSGGYKVGLIYNPSDGLMNDCLRYIYSRNGYATHGVEMLHKQWNNTFSNKESDVQIMQGFHSEGGVNVRNALMSYDSVLRKKIHLVGVATSAYTDRKYHGSAKYFESSRDVVNYVDLSGRNANINDVLRIQRIKDAPFWDHPYLSPTYTVHLQGYMQKKIEQPSSDK